MEDFQTKEVKNHQSNTEMLDNNGSDCSNVSYKEQIRKPSPGDSPSVNLALKMATSLMNSTCPGNNSHVLPVQVTGGLPPKVAETRSSSLIAPASSISMVLDQHLNSQLPPSLYSYQFATIQKSDLLENLLPSQSETLVYSSDVPIFQGSGIATYLRDLIPSLSNYASSEYQMTGPDKTILSNIMPNETVHPISAPMTSLIPPATLLVPYPLVVPLPVPFPIPIPIPTQIPQSLNSKACIRTSRTGSTIDKSTLTSPANCTNSKSFQTHSVFQDEVLDLSFKASQMKQEHTLSASPDSALDLSVVNSDTRHQNHWGEEMNGQNTQCNWTILHEGNGNKIRRSKYKDYNGRIVCSTQTAKVIVSPMESDHAHFSDKRRAFSRDCMMNSAIKPHRSQNTVPQDSFRRVFEVHPVFSEPHRHILNNRSVHFKRGGSQNMHGSTSPNKKQHMASFLSGK